MYTEVSLYHVLTFLTCSLQGENESTENPYLIFKYLTYYPPDGKKKSNILLHVMTLKR